jgi:hypothetical protein
LSELPEYNTDGLHLQKSKSNSFVIIVNNCIYYNDYIIEEEDVLRQTTTTSSTSSFSAGTFGSNQMKSNDE